MKRVKTKMIYVPAVDIATGNYRNVVEEWVPQENVVIIGASLEVGWTVGGIGDSPNPGNALAVGATLTQAAAEVRDGEILRTYTEPATVENAVNAAEGGVIDERARHDVMFPEGYGIPVLDGDIINLIFYQRNDSGHDMGANAICLVYYVVGKAVG
jgi:hypothetical protein